MVNKKKLTVDELWVLPSTVFTLLKLNGKKKSGWTVLCFHTSHQVSNRFLSLYAYGPRRKSLPSTEEVPMSLTLCLSCFLHSLKVQQLTLPTQQLPLHAVKYHKCEIPFLDIPDADIAGILSFQSKRADFQQSFQETSFLGKKQRCLVFHLY